MHLLCRMTFSVCTSKGKYKIYLVGEVLGRMCDTVSPFILQLLASFLSETGEMIQIATNDTALNVSQVWGYYTSFDKSLDTVEDSGAQKVQVCVWEENSVR